MELNSTKNQKTASLTSAVEKFDPESIVPEAR